MRLARTARGFARGARGLAYASALAAASQGARADSPALFLTDYFQGVPYATSAA